MPKNIFCLLVLLAFAAPVLAGGLSNAPSLTARVPPVKGAGWMKSTSLPAPHPGILAGGPDAFGYRWLSSRDSGGPVYSWFEIRGLGQQATWVVGNGDDGNTGFLPLGLKGGGFPFYGRIYDRIALCTNGWLSFRDSVRLDFSPPASLPEPGAPLALTAPLFMDLDTRSPAPGVFYYSDTVGGNNRFIVEWDSVFPLGQPALPLKIEVILDAVDSSLTFQYHSAVGGWASNQRSGIQNGDGAIGLTQTDSLQDAFAIRLHRPFPAHDVSAWRIVNPDANVLPSSPEKPKIQVLNLGASPESFPVVFRVDSAGLPLYQQTQTVANLAPGLRQTVYFSPPWTPGPRGASYQVLAYTALSGDSNPGNDTLQASLSVTDAFGAVLNTYTFPELGPYSLAGIGYGPSDGYFYLTSLNDAAVYKLHPDTCEVHLAFQTLHPATEVPWGIACVDTFFWVGQVGSNGLGTIDYKYTYHGVFANDTMDMPSRMHGTTAWAAGMDWDGTYLRQISVETQPTSRIFSLDLQQKIVTTWLMDPIWGTTSQRACAFLVPGVSRAKLLTGGWNQNLLYKIADTLGSVINFSSLFGLADAKAYPPSLPVSLWGLATLSDARNTLVRIALAESYVSGVEEDPCASRLAPHPSRLSLGPAYPNPLREHTFIPCSYPLPQSTGRLTLAVYDASGRCVRVLTPRASRLGPPGFLWDGRDDHGHRVSSGVYIARLCPAYGSAVRKLVVIR
jgi:FlgD Ig-like domain